LSNSSPVVESATESEVESLLVGFLEALVQEQKGAYGFTHQFAQLILEPEVKKAGAK